MMLSFSEMMLSAAFFTATKRVGSLPGNIVPTGAGANVPAVPLIMPACKDIKEEM